jgi:hypothetical protein
MAQNKVVIVMSLVWVDFIGVLVGDPLGRGQGAKVGPY